MKPLKVRYSFDKQCYFVCSVAPFDNRHWSAFSRGYKTYQEADAFMREFARLHPDHEILPLDAPDDPTIY